MVWLFVNGTSLKPHASGPPAADVHLRLNLPGKPILSVANLGGKGDYPELGPRFKACHVKQLIFWITLQSQRFADQHPSDP